MSTDKITPSSSSPNDEAEDSTVQGRDSLQEILDDYQNLLEIHAQERDDLLEQLDKLTKKTDEIENLDSRLDQFSTILLDIKQQISTLTLTKTLPVPNRKPSNTKVVATDEEINQLAQEVEQKNEDIEEEIASLKELLANKSDELQDKDLKISELNERLDLLSNEKERLMEELENMNSVIDSWKSQLDLLQKLASTDPRYKVIGALKKHGILSDIQLAFTMGTSINQLRKYIEDLIEIGLVRRNKNGKYEWIGEEIDDDLL